MSRRSWAIVCGQIREPVETLAVLTHLHDWRRAGLLEGVVVSTWLGEVDRVAPLREMLSRTGMVLVESPEPPLPSPGHLYHQMKSLEMGLHACPPDVHVLKVRTDKSGLGPEHAALLDGTLDLTPDPAIAFPPVLEGRIWIDYCFLRTPFWVGDQVFYGHARDLRRLVHYDAAYDVLMHGAGMTTEMRIFAHPFLEAFPILQEYLAFTDGIFRHHQANFGVADRIRDFELAQPWYLAVLATYHLLLRKFFAVGFGWTEEPDAWCARTGAGALGIEELFLPEHAGRLELLYNHGTCGTAARHDRWLGALVERRFRPTPFGDAYLAALAAAADPDFHRRYDPSPFVEKPERRLFVNEAKRLFGLEVAVPRLTPGRGRNAAALDRLAAVAAEASGGA
jgi:hypothetical protein